MAVGYRGGAPHNETNPIASFTITIPAGVQAGDAMLVKAVIGTAGTPTCVDNDSGGNTWTLLSSLSATASIWGKIATSGTASKTITVTNTGGSKIAGILDVFSGSHASSPFGTLMEEVNLSGDESATGITPPEAGCYIDFTVFNATNDLTASSASCTDPGMLFARQSAASTASSDCEVDSFSALQAGGPTATGAITWSQTNADVRVAALAIRPAAAAGSIFQSHFYHRLVGRLGGEGGSV